MAHPTHDLNEVVHQRTRLGLLAVLGEARKADFGFLKQTLELSDGNLSRHLQVLEQAGLVKIDKVFEGKRPRTWVRITKQGRSAFDKEMASLRALLANHGGAGT